jgi:hypothetical protein
MVMLMMLSLSTSLGLGIAHDEVVVLVPLGVPKVC